MKTVRMLTVVLIGLVVLLSPAVIPAWANPCSELCHDCGTGYACGVWDHCQGCVGCWYFTACGEDWNYGYTSCGEWCYHNLDPDTSCGCDCIHQVYDICSPYSEKMNVIGELDHTGDDNKDYCWYINDDAICQWWIGCVVPSTGYCHTHPSGPCEVDPEDESHDMLARAYQPNVLSYCKCKPPPGCY